MSIRGVYHVPLSDYPYCKNLGMSHVQVGQDHPQNHDYLVHAVSAAHEIGLHAILEPNILHGPLGDALPADWARTRELLTKARSELCKHCIILLSDEPNVRGIAPSVMAMEHRKAKQTAPQCRTLIVLGWTHPYGEYDGISDMLGFDYYGCDLSDLQSFIALPFRVKWMMHKHRQYAGKDAEFVAVPAIRKSPAHIKRQIKFWKLLGIKNLMFYNWNFDGHKWRDGVLSDASNQDLAEAIKEPR